MGERDRDHTAQATELFQRFAERNGLVHRVSAEAPVEVCWIFPPQDNLSEEIYLALQNADELNFGVGSFWSYFFPFDEAVADFESLLDDWVAGRARVLEYAFGWRLLQRHEDGDWVTVYQAASISPVRGWLVKTVQNRTA